MTTLAANRDRYRRFHSLVAAASQGQAQCGGISILPLLGSGSQGAEVKQLQRDLANRGTSPGPIDGIFGRRTGRAVRQFQHKQGLQADGIVGPKTWMALSRPTYRRSGDRPARPLPGGTKQASAPAQSSLPSGVQHQSGDRSDLRAKLDRSATRNPWAGTVHECFAYAWSLVRGAGGKSINSTNESHRYRNRPLSFLKTLETDGGLKPGMVVYVNRVPGADPSSTKLRYGPHWFVYLGNGLYRDQYSIKNLQQMQGLVPGRYIDAIFDPFADSYGA